MDVEDLVSRHPVLYHMAEDGSWESIRRLGLLSTSALLDRFGVEGGDRLAIESTLRPEIVTIEHPEYGTAQVRDNKPMQEKALLRCLVGMEPREWYETLNRRVFFWVTRERLRRLLCARPYRDAPRLVLELDTARLLRDYSEKVTLSSINSGATFAMNPAPRGRETFRPISGQPAGKPVVELTVDYAVPTVAEIVLSVSRWRCEEFLEEVWRPG